MSKPAINSVRHSFTRAMLQSALGSVLVFSVSDQNIAYFLLSVLGISIAWVFSVHPRRPAPRLVINTTLLFVLFVAGVELLRVGVGVNAFAVFAVLLMCVKMLDLRGPRDDGQILMLSVAILVAAVLTSNSLMTGVLMMVQMVIVLRAVVLFQIHAALHKSAPCSMAVGQGAKVDIRSMLLATGFLCALLGSLIFVVFPRNIGVQAFGQWGSQGSVSGFSDTVELGRPGSITESSVPVMDLTVTNRDGENVGKENSTPFYLRGAVLTQYDSGLWMHAPVSEELLQGRAKLRDSNIWIRPRQEQGASKWDLQFDVALRSSNSGVSTLFAPWMPVEFRSGSDSVPVGVRFRDGLFFIEGVGGAFEYAVRVRSTKFEQIRIEPGATRDFVDHVGVQVAVSELAWEIVRQAGLEPDPLLRPINDDQGALRVLETHLRTQYQYSLTSGAVPRGDDATRWFLFDARSGHCEYFASALAMMARSVGIPARVITGYIASDFNAVTGQYIVRESNAHAWVEAQVAPGKWRTFDGTPPTDFHAIHQPDPSIWRSVSKFYESIELLWVRNVVGYDAKAHQNLMGLKTRDIGFSDFGETLLNRFAAGRGRLVFHAMVIAGMVFAGSMVLGIILIKYASVLSLLGWRIRSLIGRLRGKFSMRPKDGEDPMLARLDRSVEQCLHRLEIPRPKWKPMKTHLQEHASTLELINEETRAALDESALLIYASRFSSNDQMLDRQDLVRLESLLRRSEKFVPQTK